MPRNISCCHNLAKGAPGIWCVQARHAAKHPATHRTILTIKNCPDQNVNSAKVQKPWGSAQQFTMVFTMSLQGVLIWGFFALSSVLKCWQLQVWGALREKLWANRHVSSFDRTCISIDGSASGFQQGSQQRPSCYPCKFNEATWARW